MLFESDLKALSQKVQDRLKERVKAQGYHVRHVSAFGFKFDSAFWIAVETDAERDRLFADTDFQARLDAVFDEMGYRKRIGEVWAREIHDPELEYLKTPGITFESQETVDRDYQGNWYYAMK